MIYHTFYWTRTSYLVPEFMVHGIYNFDNKGCKYLSLQRALVKGNFHQTLTNLNNFQNLDLKYLDLCGFSAYDEVLFIEEIIAPCHSLQKLSLTFKTLSCTIIQSIVQNGKTLQVCRIFYFDLIGA